MEESIRDYYVSEYPSDSLGPEIKEGVTFSDLDACLDQGCDVYSLIGVGDSLVRERLFGKLSSLLGCDYDDVYRRWLDNA